LIRERCSCGAKFETDDAEAIRLVRDWRKKHPCISQEEHDTPTSGTAQVEQPMGFVINGLNVPAKDYDPWEDE
jgi:hypothetical protein